MPNDGTTGNKRINKAWRLMRRLGVGGKLYVFKAYGKGGIKVGDRITIERFHKSGGRKSVVVSYFLDDKWSREATLERLALRNYEFTEWSDNPLRQSLIIANHMGVTQ